MEGAELADCAPLESDEAWLRGILTADLPLPLPLFFVVSTAV